MLYRIENLPSFTQNLRPREKKMTMAEAVVMLVTFFANCAGKKKKDRTGGEYTLNIPSDYLRSELENGKGTKRGTWTNIVQNAREVANSIWAHLDENEKSELEYIFSYIFELNGTKEISGFDKHDRYGQCKYCWRHVPIVGKSKWATCDKHSSGSRNPEVRKIMRFKGDIHIIRAMALPYIHVELGPVVSVDHSACPHLAKLMGHVPRTPLEMYKLLEFDIGVKEVAIFELVWSMATYEAWHCAHAGEATNMQEADQDAIVEITDEIWEKINKPVGAPSSSSTYST